MKNKLTATLPLALLAIGMLGSVTSANAADLNNSIYVALDAPCRVGDTRHSSNPAIPAGARVIWHAYGDDLSFQGGEATGCPQPKTDMTPTGIAVNITAVGNLATAKGNLVAFAADATPPTNSVVNYTPGTNIANSTIIGLSQDGKFAIQSNISDVPALADVQGYFYARPSGVAQVAIRGGDYSSPVDAMNDLDKWCGTPSETNTCLMKIAPGTYDVGTSPIDMQEWVSIQGSGIGTTNLYAELGGPDEETSAIVAGAPNTTLTDLSIENPGGSGGDHSTGIYFDSDDSSTIHRVLVEVSGEGVNTGIFIDGAISTIDGAISMRIRDADVTAKNGTENVGISNNRTDGIEITDVVVSVWDGSLSNAGIINHDATGVGMSRVKVFATGGEKAEGVVNSSDSSVLMMDAFVLVKEGNKNVAVYVNSSEVTMINGEAIVVNDGFAVAIVGNTPASRTFIRDATLEGNDEGDALFISDESPQTRITNSLIEGRVDNQLTGQDKNKVCRDNYDEDLQDVDCK